MARRDGKARMPWSVKGVSTDARDLAKSATARDGDTMGDWLSDVIRRVGAAQAAGRPLGPPHRRGLPAASLPASLAGRRPGGDTRPGAVAIRPGAAPPAAPPAPPPEADTVDEEALAALVAERLERTETRLVGLLSSLEDIVVRLADRLDRLEQSLDDPDDPQADRRSLPRP